MQMQLPTRYYGDAPRLLMCYTSVSWVCMRTFLTLPLRESRGDWLEPEKPGFWMPSASALPGGRGFFRLDLSGVRVVLTVEAETDVTVVFIDWTLPLTVALLPVYGRPDESVTEIPTRLPLPRGVSR